MAIDQNKLMEVEAILKPIRRARLLVSGDGIMIDTCGTLTRITRESIKTETVYLGVSDQSHDEYFELFEMWTKALKMIVEILYA